MWSRSVLIDMKRFLLFLYVLFCSVNLAIAQDWDHLLSSRGLKDISLMDSTIRINLMYATADNFMQEIVYEGLTKAWLRPEAAEMLIKAQAILKNINPAYSLIVLDAARPMSVQKKMWNMARRVGKAKYVSNPSNGGGLHNYGMAVDVSIVDLQGKLLPMGSPVDHFGEEAHIDAEELLLKEGQITQEEYDNRILLRSVMKKAGFRTILYEWWHFNACSRTEARRLYPVIE